MVNTLIRSRQFAAWLDGLHDEKARARIIARMRLAGLDHFGDCKPVGDGVSEMRIHYGPGYRVYHMRRGKRVYLILGGGEKSTQSRDIETARQLARAVKADDCKRR